MPTIALHNADNTGFPNLALMKLSAYHKRRGDIVCMYDPLFAAKYDRVYSSKVFTFTPESRELYGDVIRGGTGYDMAQALTDDIEHICPDYDVFDTPYSLGFTTRGCVRRCAWCIVPEKEGSIHAHADIQEFLRHDRLVLMDNNILASQHGIQQIEQIARLGVKVDFNQGLDARLIDDAAARLLSKVKWIEYTRLSCDTHEMLPILQRAVCSLRWQNVNPSRIFVYCLITADIQEALERVKALKGLYVNVFAQPYRDFRTQTEPTPEQKRFARWVNHKAIFKTVRWEDYQP